MLPYYEAYRKYDLPAKLRNELYDSLSNQLQLLDKLNKVNIFVGPNNSGKSLLLRELLKTNSPTYYSSENWEKILKLLQFIKEVPDKIRSVSHIHNLEVIIDSNGVLIDLRQFEQLYPQISVYKSGYTLQTATDSLRHLFTKDFKFQENKLYSYSSPDVINQYFNISSQRKLLEEITDYLEELKRQASEITLALQSLRLPENPANEKRIYIPAIRSLRGIADVGMIDTSIARDYDFQTTVLVYSGQSFADEVFKQKNSPFKFQTKIIQYEEFLSVTFFQSKQIRLIYVLDKKTLFIKIGNEEDRPIYELGDGLQMLIILTFPFFLFDAGTIVIEEPELFIHPGLQKEYINFLINHEKTKNFQIFISTHSNHILDSINVSDKISIFSVNKKKKNQNPLEQETPDFVIENLASGNENILRLLGVTSTSVYLSNCVIWVEGITDRLYLKKYIDVYLKNADLKEKYKPIKNFKEGIHYSFSLTGGDSIVHFDFDSQSDYNSESAQIIVNKFCSKSYLIVDNDFRKNKQRKQMFTQKLGDRFVELELPEIENYLPASVINEVLVEYPSVKKSVGNNALAILSLDRMKDKKVGYLIDNEILNDFPGCKKFSDDNGSVKSADKYDFCIKSVSYINATNIPVKIIPIIEGVLDFILVMNKNVDDIT